MKKIILSFLISVLISYTALAQQNLALYNMEAVPQRMYANPAFMPTQSRINIGLPLMSSEYFNFSNSGFKYSDLITHKGDSLAIDYENMLSKLSANNYFTGSFQPDILSFGFKIKKNYISFNATEKINFQIRYPKSFMEIIWKGNGDLLGVEENLNFGINVIHYREYALGFAREINDKLTVGGKLKYLYGMENIWTEKFDVSLSTDPTDFSITAKSNIKINTSGVDGKSFDNFNFKDYAFKKKNTGAGIDLGGVYKYNEKFTFSASIIDLGFIRWKDAVTSYQSNDPNGKFTYSGMDLNQLFSGDSTKNPLKSLVDTLSKSFKIDTAHSSYTTKLSTQLYLGGTYNLSEKINTGILFYSQIFDKSIHPGLSISYNQQVGRWLNFSVSYSMYNRSYNNVGLGLALTGAGAVQFYVVSDNLLGAIFPQNTKNIHLHFGFNLTFGRKTLDKDKDGVNDKHDDCPDVAGLKKLKGCPDKDRDGVSDKDDVCPNDSGLVALKGCPDRDGDGVADREDDCKDIAGLKTLKGCPDADHDGVTDKDDLCPTDSGLVSAKGCPDKDGDGVADKEDQCPTEKGAVINKGCPDRDGDGVYDKIDACPDKPGPVSNKGCPEVKLVLLDSLGNKLKTVVQAKDSSFTFDNLPADNQVRLKLEGEGTAIISRVKVMVGGVSKIAVKGNDGFLHFAVSKPEPVKQVVVKLDQKEAEVLKKAFNNLEFAAAKDIIKPTSLASLDELAGLMAKKPNWKLKISGHTDNVGAEITNLKLSQKRAEAVKNYLVSKGITAEHFKVEWFGSSKPIADNKNESGRQKNRRVEMLIFE